MSYTVKQLAEMSGVSVRTLHWYDEKGLLKPAYIGANHYRYYESEQLLQLQQILFFRELGLTLDEIQTLLEKDDFDKIDALLAHKSVLMHDIQRKHGLLNTIDKTISRLRGEGMMKDEELYHGFDKDKQAEYEQYMVKEYGHEAETLLRESKRRTAKWDKDEWDEVKNAGDAIHQALAKAIDSRLDPESPEVQRIIERHFKLQNRFYTLTKEVYIGLTSLYAEHPDFAKFFDAYHPKMIDFIGKAMRFYAKENL